MGLDATVVYPTINFRIRNPFDFPVVLHQTLRAGIVRAEILGPPTSAGVWNSVTHAIATTNSRHTGRRSSGRKGAVGSGRCVRDAMGRVPMALERIGPTRTWRSGRVVQLTSGSSTGGLTLQFESRLDYG
jgi:vancomycin resistance protein YoaR